VLYSKPALMLPPLADLNTRSLPGGQELPLDGTQGRLPSPADLLHISLLTTTRPKESLLRRGGDGGAGRGRGVRKPPAV
jgi:hypothetical protein